MRTALSSTLRRLPSNARARWFTVLVVAFVIALDRVTKYLATEYLKPEHSLSVIPKVLNLTYLENRGAAFGMLADHRAVFMVLSCIGIFAFVAFLFLHEKTHPLLDTGLAMIIGGGVGNMIDRFGAGYVVDFFDISPLFDFAIFNVADSFVCIGAGLLVLFIILEIVREGKEKRGGAEGGEDPGDKT